MMKLLLSAAAAVAVAIMFCLFSPPFIYSLSVYFSSTVHKNYVFLLCNGILLLLVLSSGLISIFSVDSDSGEAMTVKNEDRETTTPPSFETMEIPKEEIKAVFGLISGFPVDSECGEAMTVKNENREKTTPPSFETMEIPEEEIKAVFQIEDIEETENGLSSSSRVEEIEVLIEQDGEQEEDEWAHVAGMMSREELNKKCDEFIRKMKEAIRYRDDK